MNALVTGQQTDSRPVFEYDLPAEMVALNDPHVKKSVGMVKLTMQEELACIERAEQNPAKLGYYFAQRSLVEVDGRRLDKSEAEDEKVLNQTDPIIRSLILDGYLDVSTSSKAVTKSFLGSRKIKAG